MKLKRLIISTILMTTLVRRAYVPTSASDFNPEVKNSEIATDSDAEVTEEVVVTSSAPENTEKYDEKKGIANITINNTMYNTNCLMVDVAFYNANNGTNSDVTVTQLENEYASVSIQTATTAEVQEAISRVGQ